MRYGSPLVRATFLAVVLLSLVFAGACTRKSPQAQKAASAPSGSESSPGTTATPVALRSVVVLQRNCESGNVSEKMLFVKNKGGVIQRVVYQNGAFLARVPGNLLRDLNAWTDYAVLVDSTDGFDNLPLTSECRAKIGGIVNAWAKEMATAKATGDAGH